MRRSVENAEHVGLFTPTRMDSPPSRKQTTFFPRPYLPPSPRDYRPRRHIRPPGHGKYLAPARATLSPVNTPTMTSGRWITLQAEPAQARTFAPARPILTPSTSTESLRSEARLAQDSSIPVHTGIVDTTRSDDPFVGSRAIHRPTMQGDPSSENIPLTC